MIALFIIGAVSFLVFACISIPSIFQSEEVETIVVVIVALLAAIILLEIGVLRLVDHKYNDGQIDALKGIQTHEIHYVFSKGDSIPSDTLYIKLK